MRAVILAAARADGNRRLRRSSPPSTESVVRAWSQALNTDDNERAANLFAPDAEIVQAGHVADACARTREAVQWNAAPPLLRPDRLDHGQGPDRHRHLHARRPAAQPLRRPGRARDRDLPRGEGQDRALAPDGGRDPAGDDGLGGFGGASSRRDGRSEQGRRERPDGVRDGRAANASGLVKPS